MRYVRYLFLLAIPLLLWWSFRHTPLHEMWLVLRQLTPLQIWALGVANSVLLFLFSARWWLILRAMGHRIPYFTLAGYRLAGFGISYFTPGPQFGGEPLQVYLVERDHCVPRATAIASVSLDKVLEMLVNFMFLAGGIALTLQGKIFPGTAGSHALGSVLVLLAPLIGLLVAVWAGRHPVSALWRLVIRFLPYRQLKNTAYTENFYQIIKTSEDRTAHFCRTQPASMGLALFVSGVVWAGIMGEFWLASTFLGLNLGLAPVIGMLTAARLAFLLPLPAGLGALEASQVFVLTAMGLNPTLGLSLTLLIRVRDITLGVLGLWWGGLALRLPKR
jgi:uncharacterized protein (TIRG00374 family)